MLPKKHKIIRADFPTHKDKKFLWTGNVLRIQSYRGEIKDNVQFAVVVAKKQSKSAVERNMFKRSVYFALAEALSLLKRSSHKTHVIFPKKHIAEISKTEILRDIQAYTARS